MAQSTRTAMDLKSQISFFESHHSGRLGIKDLLDQVDLNKMVACTQGSYLIGAPLQRPGAEMAGICSRDLASIFRPSQILFTRESGRFGPAGSFPACRSEGTSWGGEASAPRRSPVP